jgi:hypothetical protein
MCDNPPSDLSPARYLSVVFLLKSLVSTTIGDRLGFDKLMVGWMDGWSIGWMDGWMEELKNDHHRVLYHHYHYHYHHHNHHIDKDFVDYFSKWGIVKDAVVMIDKNTYASRGFGFVTFELESSVDKVLREGHAIKGKYIECKRAEPKGFYGGGPSDGGR